jgi:hypothetical protein
MKGRVAGLLAVFVSVMVPMAAHAGWIIELRNTAISSKGERQSPEDATMYVSAGKVRTVQPNTQTIIDYKAGRFTLLNPKKELFWSGTIDEYITEMSKSRKEAAYQRFGSTNAVQMADDSPKDDSKLPKVVVRKIGDGGVIAGHETTKYQIESNGELFQEIWVAGDLNTNGDLDPGQYISVQQKLSGGMIGKAGKSFRAMWKNPDIRQIYGKGTLMQNVVRHIAGGYERTTTSVKEADVSAAEFEVPDSYRRVRLPDVLKSDKAG